MRLRVLCLAALLLAPVVPAVAAVDGAPERVTSVARDAQGRLTFRTEHVRGRSAAHARAAQLRQAAGVVAADVDRPIRIAADPLEDRQWGLTTLAAPTLWAAGDASGQVVAVIDTGVDGAHPDLAAVVRPGTDLAAGTDGRSDPNGHGTHVAGIVAAVGGNGIGGAGLAQGAAILPVRVMDANGSGFDGDAARGLVWAVDNGATVANLSFGGPDRSSVMDAAVSYALGKGVTVVVSAGNEGAAGDPVMWPAANDGVIAVAAVDVSGVRPAWSSTGSHVAVAAPGVGIVSTVPGGGHASMSGTSMAAPFVSAAAALLRRTTTAGQVRTRLVSTAVDLGLPGADPLYGAGRIDVVAAAGLSVVAPVTEPAPVPVTEASPAPVTEPAPAPVTESAPAPTSAPVTSPAPAPSTEASAPAVTEPVPASAQEPVAPVLSGRISANRTRAPYGTAVTVSTRTLADGLATGGIPVRLERRVGTSWVLTRTGTTGSDGLTSWTLRPDRTMDLRVTGTGWTSPTLRVTVTPVVSLSRLLTGRVLPTTVTAVRLQVRRGTSWVTVAYAYSRSDGTFRFTRRPAAGSVVRAVALGVASPAVRL